MIDTRQKFEKLLDKQMKLHTAKDSEENNTMQGLLKRIEDLETRVKELEDRNITKVEYVPHTADTFDHVFINKCGYLGLLHEHALERQRLTEGDFKNPIPEIYRFNSLLSKHEAFDKLEPLPRGHAITDQHINELPEPPSCPNSDHYNYF